MNRTQIYLSDSQQRDLETLGKESGNSKSEIIRQAIDEFIRIKKKEIALTKMHLAFGMWKDRDENEFKNIRQEFDRFG